MKKNSILSVSAFVLFGGLFFNISAQAGKVHVVNQVAKTFVGEATDDKIKEYSSNQDSLRAGKLEVIKIKVGDSIQFKNVDTVTHNVYGRDGEFDLKTQPVGKSDTVEFSKKGKVKVLCGIHPKMKLDVEVE